MAYVGGAACRDVAPGSVTITAGELATRIQGAASESTAVTEELLAVPAETIQVFGHDDPASWEYVLTLTGPSNSRTVRVGAAEVVHFGGGATRRNRGAV